MRKYRYFVLISVLLVILAAGAVSAQVNMNNAMKPFWDLIKYLFITLPGTTSLKYAYFKFILFLISGCAFMILMRNAPFLKEADETAKKRGDLLAWFFALAGVVSIPQKALEFMFKEFGMFTTILLGVALPTLLFIAFANKDGKARGIITAVGGALILVFGFIFTEPWLITAGVIAIVVGLVIFFGTANLGWFPTSGAEHGDHAPAAHAPGAHDAAAPPGAHAPAAPANTPATNPVIAMFQQADPQTQAQFLQWIQEQAAAQQGGAHP
jgi:hypothetical protein